MMGGTYSAKTRALSSEEGGRLSERLASIVANDKLAKTTPRSKAGCALQPWVALSRVAEVGVGSMASKAGRLKQKALSVVDSVQTLGSNNNSNSCTITVKSSPQRTAAEMTKLSVRRGWMLKRNEQRAWQRRYCCLVPHTFMYYFESKDSEVPRGVIDIEAYTDIGVEESTGAIVLGPGPDAPPGFRKYYFRPEDGRHTRFRHHSRSSGGGEGSDGGEIVVSERGRCSGGAMREDDLELPVGEDEDVFEGDGGGFLGEWLSGFHRDRFKVVRDERDAYMNLQEEYMTQMQDTTSAMSEAESERGRLLEGLRAEHAAARTAARDGLEQARALFREEELPQEEAASLPLPALLARVRAVTSERRSREAELEGQLEAAMAELREARGVEGQSRGLVERLRSEAEEATERARCAEARIRSAEEEAARERALRATAESSLENCTQRLQAAVVDVEQGQVNLGIMAGERRAALAKVAELLEQKRLLVREIKASRRSLAEASAVNRSLARAYESLDRSLRSSASNMITNTDVPTDHTGTRGESSNSVGGGEAPAAPQPFSPSSSGSAHGGGTGDVGGVNGGGGEDRHDWREVRFSTPGQGGNGRERGKGTEEATVSSASAAAKGVQVRNLSTGDVDVFNGAGRARERASTDGGPAEDPRAAPPLSAWQPHPSNIGLKITQSFANASWPWALSKTSEGGDSPNDSKPSTAPGPPGGGGGIGVGSNGAEGMSASTTSVSSSSSVATVAASALAGFSRGSGSFGGGAVRSRGVMTDVVPALHLDDDYDDDDIVHHVFSERASVVYVHGEGGEGGTVTVEEEAGGAGTGLATAEGVGIRAGEKKEARAEEGGAEEGAGGRRRSSLGNWALRCSACGGTVEGPRHSTCHCEVPAIIPDAETDRSQANQEAQATPAIQAAPTVDPVAAAAGGLSKLKGVFKSFNGKVEVARQILDSAVRQNIADNIPRQQPPKPSTAAKRSSSVSSISMHGENPAAVTIDTGSVHGAEMKPAGVRRHSTGEKEVRTTGMAPGSSGITEDSSSNFRGEAMMDSNDAVGELNRACADSTPETNAPSPPPPTESDSELEMEACSEANLAGVVGSDATGAVGTQDEVGSNDRETTVEDPPERPSRAVSIGGDGLSRTPTPPQDPLLSPPLPPSELPDPESCDGRSIERPGGPEPKANAADANSLIEAAEVSPVQAPYPPESDLRTAAPASTLPGVAEEDCTEMATPTDAAVHHGDVTVPSQDLTLSLSQEGVGSDPRDPQCTLAPEGDARLNDDGKGCDLDETVVVTRAYGEEEGSEGQGEVKEERQKESDGEDNN